jgi:hypothetical protein
LGLPALTPVAYSAFDPRDAADRFADFPIFNSIADLGDGSGKLMAHDIGLGKAMLKDMDVRPADSAVMDLDHGLVFLQPGHRNVLDLDGTLSGKNRSFHFLLPNLKTCHRGHRAHSEKEKRNRLRESNSILN